MLDAETIETGDNPTYCVIWMHGLGADGNDFVPIVPEINLPASPAIRFIFPHAPQQPVTINGGYVMRAWYDIVAPDLTAQQDKNGILASEKAICELIDQQVTQGIDPQRIVIAGFSQGGAMALHIGLRTQHMLAGIMALSCYVPLMDELPVENADQDRALPIFMGHGIYDAVVPVDAGIVSRRYLEARGYTIQWHDYPMEHSVCVEEITDIGRWLKSIIANESTRN